MSLTGNENIPKHWEVKELQELLSYVIGGDWGKDESFIDESYDFAYCIRGAEIRNWNTEKGNTASLRKIKKANIEKRKLQENDILVEISGGGPEQPVGRTVLIDKAVMNFNPKIPKVCTNFLRLIRPKQDINSKFLNYFLTFFYVSGDIVNYQAGSNNLRNLKFPDYAKISIPIPSLPEQQSIVSKIEELFSELDNSVAQLKLAQQQLKTYRQSVLKAAFEGKLTEEWRNENSMSSRGLEHSSVKVRNLMGQQTKKTKETLIPLGFVPGALVAEAEVEYQTKSKLPEGWKWVKIEDIAKVGTGVTPLKSKRAFYENGNIPWVTSGELNDEYIKTPAQFVTGTALKETNLKLYPKHTLVLALYGEGKTRGKCSELLFEATTNQAIAAITVIDPDNFFRKYLKFFLLKNYEDIRLLSSGGVQPNLNLGIVKQTKFPLPSFKEQIQIVSEIESRLSVADNLEQTINQSLQQAEALRQSILKQAFEGKLVSTIKTKEAKIIPFERKVLAAHIIFLLNDQPHFGLTKFQKTLFVAEHHAQVEHPIYYEQEVAGPYDSFFTHRFREEMVDKDWFTEETKFLVTHFIPGENVGGIIKDYAKYFRQKGSEIIHVLKLFKDKTLEESELIATLYASWNNRIIKAQEINEELLVQDLYKWSEEKKKYRKEEILSTYHWMIDVGLVPTGFGKYIDKK